MRHQRCTLAPPSISAGSDSRTAGGTRDPPCVGAEKVIRYGRPERANDDETRGQAFSPALRILAFAQGRPDRGSQVRGRLFAGASGIRTVGPSREQSGLFWRNRNAHRDDAWRTANSSSNSAVAFFLYSFHMVKITAEQEEELITALTASLTPYRSRARPAGVSPRCGGSPIGRTSN